MTTIRTVGSCVRTHTHGRLDQEISDETAVSTWARSVLCGRTEKRTMNVDALRASFNLIVERAPNLTQRFYEILFERYPQVRSLFGRNSRPAQEQMLTQALAAVIDHVEDAAWLEQTLSGMGAKHATYG